MIAKTLPSDSNRKILKMEAAKFAKLKAIVERNNKIIQQLRQEAEQQDHILNGLALNHLCSVLKHTST